MHTGGHHAPCQHVVELQQRQPRGEGGMTHTSQTKQTERRHFPRHHRAAIVEVAGYQQWRMRGHFALDITAQLRQLTHPAGADQTQMYHQDMDCAALHHHFRMEQSALLEAVIGHVLMAVIEDGPTG